MPIRKRRLTRIETLEYRGRLAQLEKMGIRVGSTVDSPVDPDRLTLDEIHDGTAKIYDLPSNAVVVAIPARLSVLKSGMLITHVSVKIPWDDCPLELNQPEAGIVYEDLMLGALPSPLPKVLNRWLKSETPLRPRSVEGVILAEGWTSFPTDHQDSMPVTVQLLIEDERHNKIKFDFEARVDRNLKRRYERKRKRYFESIQPSTGGLFEPLQPSPFWWRNGPHERRQAAASRPGRIENDIASGASQGVPTDPGAPSLEEAGEVLEEERENKSEGARKGAGRR
jgi:hypothetical protein